MNVKRFTARTARDALTLVRQAFGEDAVVLSTKPCADGVEVMAMAPESVAQIERVSASAVSAAMPLAAPAKPGRPAARQPAQRIDPALQGGVIEDVEKMAMSTLSFQGYVRERMLKRREQALRAEATEASERVAGRPNPAHQDFPDSVLSPLQERLAQRSTAPVAPVPPARVAAPVAAPAAAAPAAARADTGATRRDQQDMMNELRQVKGLIEERFGALAFMDKLQRHPAQARLTQKMLDCGFSPMLIRKMAESMAKI